MSAKKTGKIKVKSKGQKKSKFKKTFKHGSTKNKQKISVENKKFKKTGTNKIKPSDKIDKEKQKKYNRGKPTIKKMIKDKIGVAKIAKREEKIQFGVQQSVTAEVLLTEESGYLEPEEDEVSTQYTQTNIKNSVDPLSASKRFDLDLNFGPYRMNYSRNGRFLLLGGRKGHVTALDWISKKLLCEINVMESTYDVAWLHQETMFAVAQKKWVYIYDNNGIEIHCLKMLDDVYRMLFLPYHFLLATVNNNSFISWLDISIGKIVEQFPMKNKGTASSVALHPANAMICVGEPNGTVSFWGPNSRKPAISKWCHKAPVCAVAFDFSGQNFTTAGIDRTVKIWDARSLSEPLQNYLVQSAPQSIAMSQRSALALGMGNMIEVYKDTAKKGVTEKKVYLRHKTPKTIFNMEFCPFEDVLGVAHSGGYTSMLVPGSGEPNFDALEINPFQTKSQRREAEVKSLLGKIPADLITWDATELRAVDVPALEEIIEAKKQLAHIKPPNIVITPRRKMGKQRGAVNAAKRKMIMKEQFRKNYVQKMKELGGGKKETTEKEKSEPTSVLDRFKPKSKK